MLNTVSKIRGQVKNPGYPQSEGLLGECMIRHGKELGGESNFGEAEVGGLDGVRGAGWRRPENMGQSLELLRGWLAPWKRAVEASLEAPSVSHEYCLQCHDLGKAASPHS